MSVLDNYGTALSRRRFMCLTVGSAGGVLLSGLLSACGGDDDDDDGSAATQPPAAAGATATSTAATTTAAGPTATTASQPTASGTLTAAYITDDYESEPGAATIGMWPLNTNIFDQLVMLTPDYQIEPMLAESWEFIEPNTWRITLRQGVTFHDGSAFNAEAAKWSMGLASGVRSVFLSGLTADSTTVIDDATIEITPPEPAMRLISSLPHPLFSSMLALNTKPEEQRIGTGPFKEVEYVPDDHYTVEAFDGYWGEKAQVAQLTWRFIPDSTTRVLALQAGEVDVVYDVPRQSAQEVDALDNASIVRSKIAGQSVHILLHRQATGPVQERAVRLAVAYAIDKQALVEGVWQGNAEVNTTMVSPNALGPSAADIQGIPSDPDQARQVLEEAGWIEGSGGIREKDGQSLKLTLIVSEPDKFRPLPAYVQAQLKDVGIDLEIVETPDWSTYTDRLLSGEGDLFLETSSNSGGCGLPKEFFRTLGPDEAPEDNPWGYAFAIGPEVDALVDECYASAEDAKAQAAIGKTLKIAIDDAITVIPLAATYRIYGVADRVQGFVAHPDVRMQRWTGVSVSD